MTTNDTPSSPTAPQTEASDSKAGRCAVATGYPPSPGIERALALCHRLRNGAARMTRQQFRNCLKRSIGADKDYADNVRVSFQNNPAAFLAHRNPQSQSIELLRVILEITKKDNHIISDSHDNTRQS